MEKIKEIRKRSITFLLLTLAFSSIFDYIVISAGNIRAGGGLFALGAMWSPGVAALITQLLYQRNIRGLGWGWGKTRYQLWSFAVPFLYVLTAYAIVWVTGLGGFAGEKFFKQLVTVMPWVIVGLFFALGEEIGWSGLLVPQLARITGFTKTALIRGIIWAVWHYPIIIFADYNINKTPAWYACICFTVFFIGISFAFAWLRLRSGSLWTGMFLHGSHNLFIQGVFTPSTIDTGITEYFIDEFGAALAVVSVLVAYVFWKKRSQLNSTQLF